MTAKHRALYCNFQQQLVFSLNEETFISKLKQAQTSWNQAARLFLTMWIIDCKLVFQQVMAVLKHSRVGATGYRTQTQMPNCSIADWTDNKAWLIIWAPLSKICIWLISGVKSSTYNPCSKGTFQNVDFFKCFCTVTLEIEQICIYSNYGMC